MSALCLGRYTYSLNVFGADRTIDDTWNLTINDTNLRLSLGIRIQQTQYNSYLPSLEYQATTVDGGEYEINVNGDLA